MWELIAHSEYNSDEQERLLVWNFDQNFGVVDLRVAVLCVLTGQTVVF